MGSRSKHNFREYTNIANVDYSRVDDDVVAKDTLTRPDGTRMSYEEKFEEEISKRLDSGSMNKVRKNAVLGLEVILNYSREADPYLDREAWVKKNVAWLEKTFNPPDGMRYTGIDGIEHHEKTDNVKSVIVHYDESSPHIHAFIIPIDDRGRLNAKYFTSDREQMIRMQDDYAKEMAEFNLSRGERKSLATPQKMTKYYTELLKATDAELPEPLPGEDVRAYKERADEVYQRALIHHRNEIVKMNQEIIAAKSEAALAKDEVERYEKPLVELASVAGYTDYDVEFPSRAFIDDVKNAIEERDELDKGIQAYPDPDYALVMQEAVERLRRFNLEEKEKREKERQRRDEALSAKRGVARDSRRDNFDTRISRERGQERFE